MKTLKEQQSLFNGEIIKMLAEYKNPSEPYHKDVYVFIARVQYLFNKSFAKYLTQKRKEMFIQTGSEMDCELSAVREETFEKILEGIE